MSISGDAVICTNIEKPPRTYSPFYSLASGSGSTLMACEQMNRICYMMELDEKYASVILRRYVEDTGNAEGVYVIRNGQQISYAELVKEVETKEA